MSEGQEARHPTEGLPEYERQRHDAIQAEYERHNSAIAAEDEQHSANMAGINEHYQSAAADDPNAGGEQAATETA
jgi:hypothetical protein